MQASVIAPLSPQHTVPLPPQNNLACYLCAVFVILFLGYYSDNFSSPSEESYIYSNLVERGLIILIVHLLAGHLCR